jgi:MFS family permease
LFLGATLVAGASYAVNIWGVETLKRDFAWTAVQAGSAFGPIILVAGVVGSLLAPWVGRRLRARGRLDSVVVVCMGFAVVALIALGLGPTQSSAELRLALLCVGVTGARGAAPNRITAMQEVAPARMRGTFVALLFMMITLVGGGIVPVIVPWVAEMLSSRGGNLSEAMTVVCVILSGLGLLMFWWVKGTYEQEARAGFPTID